MTRTTPFSSSSIASTFRTQSSSIFPNRTGTGTGDGRGRFDVYDAYKEPTHNLLVTVLAGEVQRLVSFSAFAEAIYHAIHLLPAFKNATMALGYHLGLPKLILDENDAAAAPRRPGIAST